MVVHLRLSIFLGGNVPRSESTSTCSSTGVFLYSFLSISKLPSVASDKAPIGHRGDLLVALVDEANLILVRAKGLIEPIDSVARRAENHIKAPLDETLNHLA